MCSSLLLLAVGSRDLSQAEIEIILCKADQIFSLKMTTFFIQDHFELSFCEFAQLDIKSRDPGAN